ncbi:F-box protein SKIP8-like [Zingiber officinale]|uniref:F-box protein SKIP8-like n=1 Tax=Zingiber officinale TaxID=94328 RepID=UPI001C4D8C33|nr:F-box protein SKIP8-like [Zingiber officinale]
MCCGWTIPTSTHFVPLWSPPEPLFFAASAPFGPYDRTPEGSSRFCQAGDIGGGDCNGHCGDGNQLVPERTTRALDYLDYTSLCRLSMTNSSMRSAANDDGAWKALYHKVQCCSSELGIDIQLGPRWCSGD